MGYKTQDEKNEQIYNFRNFIGGKITDLQKFAMQIKDPEDQEGTEKLLKRIEDACVDIHKGYIRLEDIMYTQVDDAPEEDGSDSFW